MRTFPFPSDLTPEIVRHRLGVLSGLIELRKRGILWAVWCDDFRITVQFAPDSGETAALLPLVRLGWRSAERLIARHAMCKPLAGDSGSRAAAA